ncbi:MAG: hypothetical protein CMI29_07885 [Opitutae bacterium]|nr:hypothetical protein [Opitutae bacterium]
MGNLVKIDLPSPFKIISPPGGITDAVDQSELDRVQMDFSQFIFPHNLLNSWFPSQLYMSKRVGGTGNQKKATKENKNAIQSKRFQTKKKAAHLIAWAEDEALLFLEREG